MIKGVLIFGSGLVIGHVASKMWFGSLVDAAMNGDEGATKIIEYYADLGKEVNALLGKKNESEENEAKKVLMDDLNGPHLWTAHKGTIVGSPTKDDPVASEVTDKWVEYLQNLIDSWTVDEDGSADKKNDNKE